MLSAGNPVDSLDVEKFTQGYARWMRDQGYRPQAAVPWNTGDVTRVAKYLAGLVETEAGLTQVLCARDLFCLTVQWQCMTRGVTAVEWRISDVTRARGTNDTPVSCLSAHSRFQGE